METFDRDRALEDLEKLHEQILHARAQRGRVEDEFEAFTRGFRTGRAQPEPGAPGVPRTPSRHAATDFAPFALPDLDKEPPAAAADLPQVVASSPTRRRVGRTLPAIGVVALVAIAAVMFAARGREPQPANLTADAPAAMMASTPEPAPVQDTPAATAPASAAALPPGVNLEITTRRRVWMRVTLDGKRAFEREVPAAERIPLHAERSIVVRAGDAGAVSVQWNRRDPAPLGPDGIVATREFTREAPSR